MTWSLGIVGPDGGSGWVFGELEGDSAEEEWLGEEGEGEERKRTISGRENEASSSWES